MAMFLGKNVIGSYPRQSLKSGGVSQELCATLLYDNENRTGCHDQRAWQTIRQIAFLQEE